MKNITYKLPKNNKEVFLCPAFNRIPELTQENRRKIHDYTLKINGVPFQMLRDKTRREVLQQAVYYTNGIKSLIRKDTSEPRQYVRKRDQKVVSRQMVQEELLVNAIVSDYEALKDIPIIQTGHEPVFYHPGIWIKNHLTHYLTNKLGGIGINMIVDNDACNMGFMYVPILSEKYASVGKVALVKDKDHVAYEEIVFDDFGTILHFKGEVINLLAKNVLREGGKTIMEDMQGAFEQFINCIEVCYRQGCTDMVGLMTASRRSLEGDFGIKNLEVPVSWMCDTDGFYHFILHIFSEADQFAKIYNEKLAEYRGIHKIRSKANPLPDLKVLGDLVELPFWVWKAGGRRARCYRLNEGEDMKITDGVDVLVVLKKNEAAIENIARVRALMKSGMKIRPRAITTTMFARLFFSDVFIHGIGGAKYDTITDEIIKEFFGIVPPDFITISASLFLPLDALDTDAKNALQVRRQRMRDIFYNPERYAPEEIKNDRAFTNAMKEKQRLLGMIAACNKVEKRRYFNHIRDLNASMLNLINTEFLKRRQEAETISEDITYNKVIGFREYPVFIYPKGFLKDYFLNVFS